MKTLVSRSSLLTALSVLPLSKSLATTFGTFSLSQPAAGVYIHIPFCRKRCHYCDFPIKAIGGKESARQSNGESYTSTLLEDIDRWTQANGGKRTAVDTVYFGGGTPSLLPDECIAKIVGKLKETFAIDPSAEVTLEMDPGTFTYDRLLALRDIGINRISMGVQSFDNTMLKNCGRPHTVEDTMQALDDLHRANWENFSIDLISSLPFLTPELWADTLARAVQCGSSHVSVYDLQVEPGTAFARRYRPGMHPLPCEEGSADMYRAAVRALTAGGFEHYEVSNYARPGRRSRHNLKYWRCAPVLGFGMAAASYLAGERFVRPRTLPEYALYVQDLPATTTAPITSRAGAASLLAAHHSATPDMLDTVMLSLRTADGLDITAFARLYGAENARLVVRALQPYQQQGLVMQVPDVADLVEVGGKVEGNRGRLRLADPDGFIVSNDIISSVFAALPES